MARFLTTYNINLPVTKLTILSGQRVYYDREAGPSTEAVIGATMAEPVTCLSCLLLAHSRVTLKVAKDNICITQWGSSFWGPVLLRFKAHNNFQFVSGVALLGNSLFPSPWLNFRLCLLPIHMLRHSLRPDGPGPLSISRG